MNQLILAAAACALLAPGVAGAQLVLGAQAGAAFPIGDLEDGAAMKDAVARAFPLELRVGWRLDPALSLGLQGGWGYANLAEPMVTTCSNTGADCTSHLWRVAARGEYAFGGERWMPFAAATLGWEWAVQRWELSSGNWEKATRSGWLAGIEGGVDRPFSERLSGGVFVGLSAGQYRAISYKGEAPGFGEYEDAGEVASPSVHGWLSVGLRGTFSL